MEVSREDLTKLLENLSDEEVIRHLGSGTLTPLAIEVASDILRSRGVDPPSSPGSLDSAESIAGDDGGGFDLVTVSVQWDPLKANVVRALLESHGIFAHVWGEHLATAHMFLSNAGGGSRVQVRSDQVSEARELVSAFERGELKIPDLPEEDDATGQTAPSDPYTLPSNPYTPSPAVIDALATDRPSPRAPAPEDRLERARPEPPAPPRADKRARAPSSPMRKLSFVVVGLAVVLALWLMFTH